MEDGAVVQDAAVVEGVGERAERGPEGDLEVAAAAARAGAEVVWDLYGRQLARVDKGAGDFATEADLAAEEAMLAVIRAARPGDSVLGEEHGAQGATGAARQWLLDPLCGTLNYAVGNLLVAVNVALRGAGPGREVAAVADPFGAETYLTDGRTALVRQHVAPAGASESTLRPSSASRLVDVNLDPPFPGAPGFRAVDLLAHPDFVAEFRPRVVSTTLALAWVAAGKRAAYVTDGGDLTGSVHFAAGIALCRAAGCVLTGIDGTPIGDPSARGLVVAADEPTHTRLMELIRRSAPRPDAHGA